MIMTSTVTATLNTCQWCGCIHGGKCPQVKAYEYHENGKLKRVEFFVPGDYVAPIVAKPFEPYLSPFRWETNTAGGNVTSSTVDASNPHIAGYTLTGTVK